MAKLTREDKIDLYKKWKSGQSLSSLFKEYGIRFNNIQYLVRLIDYHGEDILRNDKNNFYSKELKQEIIDKVLVDGEIITSAAILYGLSSNSLLFSWIKSYKESNYVIVEKKKGRQPHTMTKPKTKRIEIDYASMNDDEKIKYLEEKKFSIRKR